MSELTVRNGPYLVGNSLTVTIGGSLCRPSFFLDFEDGFDSRILSATTSCTDLLWNDRPTDSKHQVNMCMLYLQEFHSPFTRPAQDPEFY